LCETFLLRPKTPFALRKEAAEEEETIRPGAAINKEIREVSLHQLSSIIHCCVPYKSFVSALCDTTNTNLYRYKAADVDAMRTACLYRGLDYVVQLMQKGVSAEISFAD